MNPEKMCPLLSRNEPHYCTSQCAWFQCEGEEENGTCAITHLARLADAVSTLASVVRPDVGYEPAMMRVRNY